MIDGMRDRLSDEELRGLLAKWRNSDYPLGQAEALFQMKRLSPALATEVLKLRAEAAELRKQLEDERGWCSVWRSAALAPKRAPIVVDSDT